MSTSLAALCFILLATCPRRASSALCEVSDRIGTAQRKPSRPTNFRLKFPALTPARPKRHRRLLLRRGRPARKGKDEGRRPSQCRRHRGGCGASTLRAGEAFGRRDIQPCVAAEMDGAESGARRGLRGSHLFLGLPLSVGCPGGRLWQPRSSVKSGCLRRWSSEGVQKDVDRGGCCWPARLSVDRNFARDIGRTRLEFRRSSLLLARMFTRPMFKVPSRSNGKARDLEHRPRRHARQKQR